MSEELTNLNWLSFAPIELDSSQVITVNCITTVKTNKSLGKRKDITRSSALCNEQVTIHNKRYHCMNAKESTELHKAQQVDRKRMNGRKIHRSLHKRPQCSYSCLITMALKASDTGCLPVHLIYKYIEQEFPYFKTAPDGWKNSIRHNLSMNQNFIKVSQNEIPSTKKGFLWAINPSRIETLNQEIDKTLKTMGRRLIENAGDRQTSPELFSITSAVTNTPSLSNDVFDITCSIKTLSSEQHLANANLQTLNSIVGLKTRERIIDNSKFEWSPLFPERQSSSETVKNLFGISVDPDEKLDHCCSNRLSSCGRPPFITSSKEDYSRVLSPHFEEDPPQIYHDNSDFDNTELHISEQLLQKIEIVKSENCLYDASITPVNGTALKRIDDNDFENTDYFE